MEVSTSNSCTSPSIMRSKSPLPKSSTDAENKNSLPENFRTTNPPYSKKLRETNTLGLENLNISASGQFSEGQLKSIIKELQPLSNFIIVDLREECHGFFNGNAISWISEKDQLNSNKNLTYSDIVSKEKDFLLEKSCRSNAGVSTEYDLLYKNGLSYLRLPIAVDGLPSINIVDSFVDLLKTNLIKKTHLHFHCRKGSGRAGLFMIMYDMMNNAKDVSFQDILKRQSLLGAEDLLSKIDSKKSYRTNINDKIAFLNKFYKYCLENSYTFDLTWSNWLAK